MGGDLTPKQAAEYGRAQLEWWKKVSVMSHDEWLAFLESNCPSDKIITGDEARERMRKPL